MEVNDGPAVVRGFRFAGAVAGLKPSGAPDMGLAASDTTAAAAAVFTTNRVKAAPVVIGQERIRGGKLRAVIVNSGSANCFTGAAGLKLARDSSAALARELGCAPELVVPSSTGVIGRLYDFDKYRAGVSELVRNLSEGGLESFARAIMTTDTRPKMASIQVRLGRTPVTIAGAAKGAGMISPWMATLLGFVVSDAAIPAAVLKSMLRVAVAGSFNAITVDGDMSTNDTIIAMANGAAGNPSLSARDRKLFTEALSEVCLSLARQLVYDGEGATKLVEIDVRGAKSPADAERVARQVANSPLVKTAFFGSDPNVGRILMAAGASGAALEPDRIALKVGGVTIASRGAVVVDALEEAGRRMREREFKVELDLRLGRHSFTVRTCDLSYDYVKINAEYTT